MSTATLESPTKGIEKFSLYNGEIELLFEDVKHRYTIDNKTIFSATGIVGVLDKPALIGWAANKAADHFKDNIKRVWTPDGIDEVKLEELYAEAKAAHRKFKTDAGNVGTLVHAWIEKFIKGQNPVEPVNAEIKAATDAFKQWVSEHQVTFNVSEAKIYSKKYNYAGTMDFEAVVDGKLIVGDIKTSSGIYPEMRFQTAAYQQARQEELGKEYDHRVIIRVGKVLIDGKPDFEIAEFNDFDKDFKGFLGALLAYNRLQELKNGN